MSLKKFAYIIVLLVVLQPHIGTASAFAAGEKSTGAHPPLVMGVFPRRPPAQTMQMYAPLAKELSKALGRKVVLATSMNFKSFWQNLSMGQYDIVHCNQYHYLRAHKEFGFEAVASNIENGVETIAGAIVVPAQSPVEDLAQLKGKRIVFGGGKQAMQSYIIPRYLLSRAGLKSEDYQTTFAVNPAKGLSAVVGGSTDAAGVGDAAVLNLVKAGKIPEGKVRVLASGPSLPHLPWAVKKSLGPQFAQKVRQTLVALSNSPHGQSVLKTAKVTGFSPRTDSDYNEHRSIVRVALGESL